MTSCETKTLAVPGRRVGNAAAGGVVLKFKSCYWKKYAENKWIFVALDGYRPVICGWYERMEDAARNSRLRAVSA